MAEEYAMTTWLHEQRLDAVEAAIRARGVNSMLDLGCGEGDLLRRIVGRNTLGRVVAVDMSSGALASLRAWLSRQDMEGFCDVELVQASATELSTRYCGFDCAILVEVIEHLELEHLRLLEHKLFAELRPRAVIVTTPNAELNPLLGVPAHRFRHRDHRFEWDREQFRNWADALARRYDYRLQCSDIAGSHPKFGGASQMAVFDSATPGSPAD